MANFDLSMSSFLVPGLRNYQPKVGRMKSQGVSLTTLEVVNNMATPYTRVFTMTDGDTVSGPVEADCTVIYRTTASQRLDLTSLKGSPGVRVNFILEGTGSLELVLSSGVQQTTCTLTPQASIAQVYPLNSGGVQTGWVVGDASITASIGTLSSLTTTAKTNLVSAINEVQSEVNTATSTANTNKTAIGTLSSLTTTAKTNLVAAVNEVQSEVNGKRDSLVTKTYTMPALTTAGTRYIKIATCPWDTIATIRCHLYGNSFEDNVFINICGGHSTSADSCGWYTTHGRSTQAVIIKRGAAYDASFEVWLKIFQYTTLSVRLYAEKVYSGILNTDTSLNITATAPSGSIAEHSLMDKHNGFFGNMPSANDNTYRYTFVVDSNAALTAWADNDRSGGKDYTSVLIRKGTWTSTKGVNLTTAGTKVVVGEAGSKLVFNDVGNGLYYDSAPTTADYYMRGVTVTGSGSGSGFRSCTHLTNCSGTGTSFGFNSCTNLSNCTGTGSGTGAGFSGCNNLTNCTGNCSGTGFSPGFSGCNNLTNCTGTGTGTKYGRGFYNCNNLTNCTGTGTGTESGYGFYLCTVVIGCKAGGHCTSNAFQDCYASSSKTSTFACADTANGGFNNTTNPS